MEKTYDALPYQGLTGEEAARRAAAGQSNRQPRLAGKSAGQILAGNLFTLFNLLNFILAAALIAVGSYRNLLFLGVVFSNALIGTVQELRAKRTIDKLELLSAPVVRVVRDGQVGAMPMEDVVLGDLLILAPGDQVCADAELIAGEGAVDESLLTGESEPVSKAPGDTLLSGSFLTEGTLYAKATQVGADSYAAQLTLRARTIKKPHSELMQSMRYIIRAVSAVLIPLGVILFLKQYFRLEADLHDAVTSTVAAVLGMIPEGLMLLTSVALAVGVVRLGRQRTLVQELYGIESLARVDTLCMDKTGTITKGAMKVVDIVTLEGIDPQTVEEELAALVAALEDNNPTFTALRERCSGSCGGLTAVYTVPFSPARKWSAVSFHEQGTCVVGAAEFVLGGQIDPALQASIDAYARQGLRVLLLCRSPEAMTGKALPGGLAPRALVLLSDVLREDAEETVAFFTRQDVALKVISGDSPLTVMNVAKQAGIPGAESAVDATTLDTPEKLAQAATRYTVFGRVTPEQKKDLVRALKKSGHTVGMMGDGVNDIPALKASDCSIAIAGGSDAARRVSQLILLDANFSAVPEIVMEGRRVINNITRAASLFLVKTTFSFLLSLLLVFLPMHYPFAPIQMTLISTLTVGIPSFFLALEPNRARVKGDFLYNVLRNALPGGLTIVTQILIIFALSGALGLGEEARSTIATWTTGCAGLVVLLFTCLPLNFTRLMLLLLMTLAFFTAGIQVGDVFYLESLTLSAKLLTAGLIAASPLVMALMRWLVKRFWHQRNPSPQEPAASA